MANEEQLRILKQGVDAWNEWRRAPVEVEGDLSAPDHCNADLSRADLRGMYLGGADLSHTDLSGANLSHAKLGCADLSHADLSSAILYGADIYGVNFRGAVFASLELGGADLRHANLSSAKLTNISMRAADLSHADLTGACTNRVDLRGSVLNSAKLRDATFRSADLRGVKFRDADFSGAQLGGAQLDDADLSGADLSGVDLTGGSLISADLTGVILARAKMHRALMNRTRIVDVNLSEVEGLETVQHTGPSELSISTIYNSEGEIPEAFLHGCGLPESFINLIPSLVAALQPIQFYSCFISYSGRDEEFAKRLHSRMREAELRVWFAPEDMKGGDKIYDQIDRAIQVHDRLLLVLSEDSLQSDWVETEIRRARKVELREKRRKLFPIRLVGYEALLEWVCIDSTTGEDLAEEVRSYFIPDFSDWKSHDDFERAFARLLADLKASA